MTLRQTIRSFLFLSLLPVLAGCAYSTEESHQDITFVTPGAMDAKCLVYIEKLQYRVFPPQTVNMKKSSKEMRVDCQAPGNRSVEIFVEPELSKRALWGGPPGMAWDYASRSLHYYPSVIAVDFSKEALVPNDPPEHNNPDIRQPETYDLEEFRPSNPRLNSDKNRVEPELMRRGEVSDAWDDKQAVQEEGADAVIGEKSTPAASGKGELQSVIDGLTQSPAEQGGAMQGNPQVTADSSTPNAPSESATPTPSSSDAAGEPVSLYPGQ